MGKRILIGSMLVLSLLLLMPSIPAIQQKTIEDKAFSDFVEELKNVDLEDIKVLDDIRHPELYALVVFLLSFSWDIGCKLTDIAVTRTEDHNGFKWDIHYPILLLYTVWFFFKIDMRMLFWNILSNKLGWGWKIDYSIFWDN